MIISSYQTRATPVEDVDAILLAAHVRLYESNAFDDKDLHIKGKSGDYFVTDSSGKHTIVDSDKFAKLYEVKP